MSDKLLLVTGATGQIGSAVVLMGLEQGYKIRIVARSPELAEVLFQDANVEIIKGNILDPSVFKKMLPNVTHLCHCAARVGDWGAAKEYWDTNVEATSNLLVEINRTGSSLQKFVHFSSLGVYEPRDHFGTTEDTPNFKNGLDAYALSKVASEDLVLNFKFRNEVDAIVLRPGFVYGPGDRHVLPGVINAIKKKFFLYLGDGEQTLDNISVHNVADACRLALQVKGTKDRVFNITDNECVTRNTFINTIADYLALSRPNIHLPKSVGKTLAETFDFVGRKLNLKHPPMLSRARYKFLALNLEFSIDRARQQLGYNPQTTFVDGMRSALDWYTKAGDL